ncbi:hypothetical protein KKH43_03010 [Patescibacteria group bacterium]|nr:hypothetical protein [Patescibacteria group bacterium]
MNREQGGPHTEPTVEQGPSADEIYNRFHEIYNTDDESGETLPHREAFSYLQSIEDPMKLFEVVGKTRTEASALEMTRAFQALRERHSEELDQAVKSEIETLDTQLREYTFKDPSGHIQREMDIAFMSQLVGCVQDVEYLRKILKDTVDPGNQDGLWRLSKDVFSHALARYMRLDDVHDSAMQWYILQIAEKNVKERAQIQQLALFVHSPEVINTLLDQQEIREDIQLHEIIPTLIRNVDPDTNPELLEKVVMMEKATKRDKLVSAGKFASPADVSEDLAKEIEENIIHSFDSTQIHSFSRELSEDAAVALKNLSLYPESLKRIAESEVDPQRQQSQLFADYREKAREMLESEELKELFGDYLDDPESTIKEIQSVRTPLLEDRKNAFKELREAQEKLQTTGMSAGLRKALEEWEDVLY